MSEQLERVEDLLDKREEIRAKLDEFIENSERTRWWVADYMGPGTYSEPFKSQRVTGPAAALYAELRDIEEKFKAEKRRVEHEISRLRAIVQEGHWHIDDPISAKMREHWLGRALEIELDSSQADAAFEKKAGVKPGWLAEP